MTRKYLLILFVVVVAMGFIGGAIAGRFLPAQSAVAQEDDTITAQTFTILDDEGRVRIILTTSEENNQPLVIFMDEDGSTLRQVFGLTDNGEPTFSLADKKGITRLGGANTDAEGPAIFINDQKDKMIWSAP
ncbi:MAG: hypothetical protein AB1546_06445 [bacterium]